MKTFSRLWQYLAKFFLDWEIVQTKVAEKIKTHILCSVTFPESRVVYEIMSKNMVEPGRPQITIQYDNTRCMLDKQGYTLASTEICNTYCISMATMVL